MISSAALLSVQQLRLLTLLKKTILVMLMKRYLRVPPPPMEDTKPQGCRETGTRGGGDETRAWAPGTRAEGDGLWAPHAALRALLESDTALRAVASECPLTRLLNEHELLPPLSFFKHSSSMVVVQSWCRFCLRVMIRSFSVIPGPEPVARLLLALGSPVGAVTSPA